ncbi:MAG: hypothetical protein GXY96_10330 [Tissierellia bacterium]|nr:hypothetical protein [Tissierellia bacterium]
MNLMDGSKLNFLVETALLGHGLVSVKDEEILSLWPEGVKLAWVEEGRVRVGTIEDFIPARKEAEERKKPYHPAANACFDRLSLGLSSKIQLESLISNIKVAQAITDNR